MSILNKTQNFFELYRHISGKSEVPDIYHFWSCVALLSAVLEDRVWFELYRDEPLKPNLYIGLIGPGSLGKGIAISQATKLVTKATNTQIYRGAITFAHLIDRIGRTVKNNTGQPVTNSRLWLVMDELKNDVGSNKTLCEYFIAMLTELYTGTNYNLDTGTRTNGEVSLKNTCLNWLFGSNEAWLREVLTNNIHESGFVARTIFIFAHHNLNNRIPRAIYPDDRDEVYDYLKARLWAMQGFNGQFIMTPTAEAEHERWYLTRPAPEEEALFTMWKRQQEMLIRFAMINAAADITDNNLIITHSHLIKAIHMVRQVNTFTCRLLEAASETPETKPINEAGRVIQRRGSISHSDLLKYMRTNKGYKADRLKDAVFALTSEGLIKCERSTTGGLVYVWLGEENKKN